MCHGFTTQYKTLAFSFCVSDPRNLMKKHLVISYDEETCPGGENTRRGRMTRDRGRLTPRPSGEAGPPGGATATPGCQAPAKATLRDGGGAGTPWKERPLRPETRKLRVFMLLQAAWLLRKREGKPADEKVRLDWQPSVHGTLTEHSTHTHTHSRSPGHASRLPLRCGRSHRSPSVPEQRPWTCGKCYVFLHERSPEKSD